MAWNRPNETPRARTQVAPQRKRLWLYAGAFILLAGGVAAWWLWPDDDSANKTLSPRSRGQIKEVTPAKAKTATNALVAVAATTAAKPASTNLGPQKVGEVRNGYVKLPDGTLHRRRGLKKVAVDDNKPRPKYAIFDHDTDNEFAALISLKPGEILIGGALRHDDYKADFLKSLETPIIITRDDTEEQKALKRAVIEVRKNMKDAIDAGEDPTAIVNQAYEDARKLARYKGDLQGEVEKNIKDGDYTDAEVQDLIGAANKMLEAKGIAPLHLGIVAKARLKAFKK